LFFIFHVISNAQARTWKTAAERLSTRISSPVSAI
jgi:hypothetical protein